MMELTWRQTDYLLKQWGRWVWLFHESVGCYPSHSSSVGRIEKSSAFNWFQKRQLTAKGKGTRAGGSHKILHENARVMPDFIKQVNVIVGTLPEGQYMAVIVKYATGLDANHEEWPDELRAFALGITLDAMNERLRVARNKIAKKLAKVRGAGVQSVHPRICVSA